MSYTYSGFAAAFAAKLVIDPADPNFMAMLPDVIAMAEARIARDLDPEFLRATATVSASAVDGAGNVALPFDYAALRSVSAVDAGGAVTPLDPRSDSWLDDYRAGGAAPPSGPRYYATPSYRVAIVYPPPAAGASIVFRHVALPANLSAEMPTTPIATHYPDLMLAAALVVASGFQRNFGAMSDDPRQAMSWEGHYQTLLSAAKMQEAKRRGGGFVDYAPPTPAPSQAPV